MPGQSPLMHHSYSFYAYKDASAGPAKERDVHIQEMSDSDFDHIDPENRFSGV